MEHLVTGSETRGGALGMHHCGQIRAAGQESDITSGRQSLVSYTDRQTNLTMLRFPF